MFTSDGLWNLNGLEQVQLNGATPQTSQPVLEHLVCAARVVAKLTAELEWMVCWMPYAARDVQVKTCDWANLNLQCVIFTNE